MKKQEVIIIRGLPGSGKSTYAEEMFPNHVLCEADQYFINNRGDYIFNPKYLKLAHEYCREKAFMMLQRGHSVVVANTFSRKWEMVPYFRLGVPYKVYKMTGEFKSIHNIPYSSIKKIKERWEDYPTEIEIRRMI